MLSKTSWCDKPWFLSSYLWIMELMDLIYTLPIMPYSENHKDALQTAVIGGEIWQHVQPWVFWSSRPAVVVRSSLSTHVTLDIRCVVHQAEHVVFRPMWHWCVCVCVCVMSCGGSRSKSITSCMLRKASFGTGRRTHGVICSSWSANLWCYTSVPSLKLMCSPEQPRHYWL